jgi:hypothetical protein
MAADSPLLEQIIQLAKMTGWLIHHQRPALTANGYRSTIRGHKGWPDLALAHPNRASVFLEIKPERGYPTEEQVAWLASLPNAYLVRPSDWPQVEAVLTGRDGMALRGSCALHLRPDGWWFGTLAVWAQKRFPGNGAVLARKEPVALQDRSAAEKRPTTAPPTQRKAPR